MLTPLTKISPRSSRTNPHSIRIFFVASGTWIRPLIPVLSMRLARLTVDPQISYWGLVAPITPATTGPWAMPIFHPNQTNKWLNSLHDAATSFTFASLRFCNLPPEPVRACVYISEYMLLTHTQLKVFGGVSINLFQGLLHRQCKQDQLAEVIPFICQHLRQTEGRTGDEGGHTGRLNRGKQQSEDSLTPVSQEPNRRRPCSSCQWSLSSPHSWSTPPLATAQKQDLETRIGTWPNVMGCAVTSSKPAMISFSSRRHSTPSCLISICSKYSLKPAMEANMTPTSS